MKPMKMLLWMPLLAATLLLAPAHAQTTPSEPPATSTPADFPPELKFGTTPSGSAFRFVYQASYDEIDGAYEQITAYLDAKDIAVEDTFIEEFLTMGAQSDDPATDINIYVKPKQ